MPLPLPSQGGSSFAYTQAAEQTVMWGVGFSQHAFLEGNPLLTSDCLPALVRGFVGISCLAALLLATVLGSALDLAIGLSLFQVGALFHLLVALVTHDQLVTSPFRQSLVLSFGVRGGRGFLPALRPLLLIGLCVHSAGAVIVQPDGSGCDSAAAGPFDPSSLGYTERCSCWDGPLSAPALSFSEPRVSEGSRPLPTPCRGGPRGLPFGSVPEGPAWPRSESDWVNEDLTTLLDDAVKASDEWAFLAATLLDTLVEHFAAQPQESLAPGCSQANASGEPCILSLDSLLAVQRTDEIFESAPAVEVFDLDSRQCQLPCSTQAVQGLFNCASFPALLLSRPVCFDLSGFPIGLPKDR